MFIFDPIASLIVVAGVFIYFACKGSGKKKPSDDKKSEKDFYMWLAEGCDRRNHDKTHGNRRWVEEHFKE